MHLWTLWQLKSKDWWTRGRAVEQLGNSPSKQALKALIQVLNDEESSVRRSAAQALGKIGSSEAVEPLVASLHDQESSVRWAVAEALGKIGDSEAVKPLITALKDEDKDVRKAAAEALASLHWQPINDTQRALEAVAFQRWNEAAPLGDAAVEPLLVVFKHPILRQKAAEVLVHIGQPAVEPLAAMLTNRDQTIRWAAIETMGKIGGTQAAQLLVTTLKQGKSEEQETAVQALIQIGQPAVDPLIDIFEEADSNLQEIIKSILVNIKNAAVDPLVTALKHSDVAVVRRTIVQILGEIGDPQAVAALVPALDDRDWGMRWAAAQALGKIGDTRAVEPLVAALNDQESSVRWTAAEALGEIGDPQAIESLTALLNNCDLPFVRRQVVAALGKIGGSQAKEVLTNALNDEDSDVQEVATQALAKMEDG